jgi:hypothetical protein
MKYVVTESQLDVLIKEDRVQYLKGQSVITPEELDKAKEGDFEAGDERPEGGMRKRVRIEPIEGHDGVDIAYLVTNKKGKQRIKVTEEIFNDIVDADPTPNKEYVQWMLEVFARHVKDQDIDQAVRFLTEDLPEANEFLGVFHNVKKKKMFKTGAPNRPNAPENVSDIRQYQDLAHLYSIVSPFIGMDDDDEGEDGESRLWKKLKKFIDLGHARLAYRDNDVLVYTPQTIESSCEPLGPLASWCTRREGNSYFDSYRRNNPKPDGTLSDYYVIMPKNLFDGDDEGMFPLQFHFESNQLHDKNNRSIERGEFPEVMKRFPGMKEFFKNELGVLATADVQQGTGLMDSRYIKYLNMFGGKAQDVISDEVYAQGVENIRAKAAEQTGPLQQNKYLQWLMENTDGVIITDYLDTNMENLDFSGMNLGELPDLSAFTNLNKLMANNSGLNTLPPADYLPDGIEIISMTNNSLPEVPLEGYEKLTNCFVMNFDKNPITKINVGVLRKLAEEALARFVVTTVDLEALSPENREEFEEFKRDPEDSGYMVS